jgi:cleavage and polyadenylation specificity factor subunit 2
LNADYVISYFCFVYSNLYFQFGTLARMLQVDPPPKAVKVTMSKRVPLVGDELKAYDEEQEKIKKEEALKKASITKVEEVRAASSHLSGSSKGEPMVIDSGSAVVSSEGNLLNSK